MLVVHCGGKISKGRCVLRILEKQIPNELALFLQKPIPSSAFSVSDFQIFSSSGAFLIVLWARKDLWSNDHVA